MENGGHIVAASALMGSGPCPKGLFICGSQEKAPAGEIPKVYLLSHSLQHPGVFSSTSLGMVSFLWQQLCVTRYLPDKVLFWHVHTSIRENTARTCLKRRLPFVKTFFSVRELCWDCAPVFGVFFVKAAFTAKKFEPIYINMEVTSRHGETTVSLIFPNGYCRKDTRKGVKGVKVKAEQTVLVNFSSAKQQELNTNTSSLHLNSQRVTFSHGTRMNPLTFQYSLTL